MATAPIVRLHGVSYRARARYASDGGLDPLAEFFYSVVLPEEGDLGVLRTAFGLPPRIVEDVLAHLLRQNYAVLDVGSGKIRPQPRSQRRARREFKDSAHYLSLWQDSLTGAVLPSETVQPYERPLIGNVQDLVPPPALDFVSFLDLPDARIIASLADASSKVMRNGALQGFVLDALLERVRERELDIFLEIAHATIDDERIEFIAAPGLPRWLTRAWSLMLGRRTGAITPARVALATQTQGVGSPRMLANPILERCRFQSHLDRWRGALDRLVDLEMARLVASPAAVTVGDVTGTSASTGTTEATSDETAKQEELKVDVQNAHEEIAEAFAALRDCVATSAHVALRIPSGDSHLADLRGLAKHSLVVVSSSDKIERDVAAGGDARTSIEPVFVDGSGRGAEKPLPGTQTARSGRPIATRSNIAIDAAVADGREVRLGRPSTLASAEPVICVRGKAATIALVTGLLAELDAMHGGWWISEQLRRSAAGEGQDPDVETDVLELIADLATLPERLQDLSGVRDPADTALVEAAGASAETSVLPAAARALLAEAEGWCDRLSSRFPRERSVVVPVPGGDMLAVLTEVLAESNQQHEIDLITSELTGAYRDEGLVALFERSVRSRTQIRIFLSVTRPDADYDAAGRKALDALAGRVRHDRFRVGRCTIPLPVTMIIDSRLVVTGTTASFDLSDVTGSNAAVAMEAPHAAAAIQELLLEGWG